jgi:hypothetical protein
MKKLLASVALLASVCGVAHADPATTNTSATIGAQVNEQSGYYNTASNSAVIAQESAAFAAPGLPWLMPSGAATTNTSATIGAQVNSQYGVGNVASNSAVIEQSSLAAAGPSYPTMLYPYAMTPYAVAGGTAATNTNATIGAQVNTQIGEGNVAANSAFIGQRSQAVSEGLPLIALP